MKQQDLPKAHNNAELVKQGREIVLELKKYDNQVKRTQMKKYFLILVVLALVVLLIKLIFHTIEIDIPFEYPENKSRVYEVKVNDTIVAVETHLKQKISVIPYLVNVNRYYRNIDYIYGNENIYYEYNHHRGDFKLKIQSYSCLKNKKQVRCSFDGRNQKWVKMSDTKYTHLTIIKKDKKDKELYDGKYISDVTKYIQDKGIYHLEITAKYDNIETKILLRMNKLKDYN